MITKKEKLNIILSPQKKYTIQNNTICFLPGNRLPVKSAGEGLFANIQDIIKRYGQLYYIIVNLLAPILPSLEYRKKLKSLLRQYTEKHIIVNLGSGPHHIMNRKDIINIDIFAFDEVDVAADAFNLPIIDNTVDLIINIAMLEHIANPRKVMEEMARILRPGGEIICDLPFLVPFHAAPNDFYRWTISGIKELCHAFKDIEIGISGGPISGMLWAFQECVAILFSFGSKTVHDIMLMFVMVLTSPLKLLDLILVKFPYAEKISASFYMIAKK